VLLWSLQVLLLMFPYREAYCVLLLPATIGRVGILSADLW